MPERPIHRSAKQRRAERRRARQRRQARIELGIGIASTTIIGGLAVADYIVNGKVNQVLAGFLLTIALGALGRYADFRRDERDD